MAFWTLTQSPPQEHRDSARVGQMLPPERRLERVVEAMDFAQSCPQCQLRTQHGGCPMEVFDFDQGRYMCDTYLDSFTG